MTTSSMQSKRALASATRFPQAVLLAGTLLVAFLLASLTLAS